MKQAAIDFYPSDITIFTQPHDYVDSACDTGLLFKTFCILQTFFTPSRVSDSDTVLLFETFVTMKPLHFHTLACSADPTCVSCSSLVTFQWNLRGCGKITFLEIRATIAIDPSSEIRDGGKYVVAAVRNRLWSAEQIMDGGKRQILHGGRHKSSPAIIRTNKISSWNPK